MSKIIFLSLITILIILNHHTYADDNLETLKKLQQIIIRQQEELYRQAEQIRQQGELLNTLKRQIEEMQKISQSQQTPSTSTKTFPYGQILTSGDERYKVILSGQVNRAVNLIDDGSSTEFYQVDNNASCSRLRILGFAKVDDDISLGTRIEFAVAPDLSSQSSQLNRATGTWFDQRWTEISITSKNLGKLSIGKGDTSSNTSAEMDISMTDVVQYATLSDIAGGMFFREKAYPKKLTSIKISDAFNSRDGLSRQSRLRYDTPEFYGLKLTGSLVSNQRYDLAVFYNYDGENYKALSALALSDPNLPESKLQYDGSFSILHKDSGINLTLSGGLLNRTSQKDAKNLYLKLGWIANLTRYGHTAFGIDYTYSGNLPLSGDKGYSASAAIVQHFKSINADAYLQYRIHSLNLKSSPPVSDINVGTLGMRVRF